MEQLVCDVKKNSNETCAVRTDVKESRVVEAASGHLIGAEIEINDCPQYARWTVTRNGALSSIMEQTGCAITLRGIFVPHGRPPEGERKLYLRIEGLDVSSVNEARTEIECMLTSPSPHELHVDRYTV
jgi:hypothetical protein